MNAIYNIRTILVSLIAISIISMGFSLEVNLPKESLAVRLDKLAKIYNVNISFDKKMVNQIQVDPITERTSNLEHALTQSLKSTGLTWAKLMDGSVIVKQNKNQQVKIKSGKVRGVVTDENGEPIVGANVVEVNSYKGAVTGFDGDFELVLPPGEYTFRISFVSFQTQEITKVEVVSGEVTPLPVILKEENLEIEGVVVTAEYKRSSVAALFAKQKATVSMTDGLSADMIKKTSDNNVAQTLKRIVGVNVSKGKYVVIRGMGERYNNVELNGASMPSTEPNRRNFAFDVLPTAIVDNVVVAKTFTPDMQGEFSGGLVKVNTLSMPTKKVLKLSTGTGFNTQSTGKEFLSNTRYKEDYLLGTDKRDWFNEKWSNDYLDAYNGFNDNKNTEKKGVADKSYEQFREMGKAIPNHWGMQKFTGAPTQSYSMQWGIPIELPNKNTIGFITSVNYRHEEKREDFDYVGYDDKGQSDDGVKCKFITNISGMFNTGWKNSKNKISFKNLYNYRFNHENWSRTQVENDEEENYAYAYHNPQDNTIIQTRLEGWHKIANDKIEVDWFGDYNSLNRHMPESRYTVGSYVGMSNDGEKVVRWKTYGPNQETSSSTHVYSSSLKETKHNIGGNIKYKFDLLKQSHFFKTGYLGTYRHSHFYQGRYLPGDRPDEPYIPAQDVWSDDNYQNEVFDYIIDRYELNIAGANKYKGDLDIHAAYVMGNFKLLKKLEITGGIRLENTKMTMASIQQMEIGGDFIDTTLTWNEEQWLPATTLTYNITKKLKIKGAYGKTVGRPDFRERTGIKYWDLERGRSILGHKGVENSMIDNYDLRFEWYPSNREIFSVNLFYKEFYKVIENYIIQNTNEYSVYVINLDKAITKGIEVNLRKSFKISPLKSSLVINGNVTIMDGKIEFDGGEFYGQPVRTLKEERLIMGLSPESYNAGVEWNSSFFGMSVNYNRTGRILLFADGTSNKNDEYRAPREVIGAQLRFKLLQDKLGIKINGSNLFNKPVINYNNYQPGVSKEDQNKDLEYNNGDRVTYKGYTGRSYSMSLSYNF